jgi:predicted transcriptional regulator
MHAHFCQVWTWMWKNHTSSPRWTNWLPTFSLTLKGLKMHKANKVQVHVGSLADMGKRFVSAWNRAATGKKVSETHTTFLDVQTMLETLSPRRLELLKFVRQHGADSVKGLATSLGRDYKNVHHDVSVLESAGLLLRDGRKLSAPWDELSASVSLMH